MIARLTFLLVCVAVTSGNPAAGRPWHWKSPKPLVTPFGPVKSSRIVGGKEATPHAWPHQVALFIDDLYFCGGSLISNEWVLTAAHCLDGATFAEVVLGAHNIQMFESSQVTLASKDFIVHENWNDFVLINDIALIKLPVKVNTNEFIKTVGLPSVDLTEGTLVTVTGWGKISDSATEISDVLQEVEVPIMNQADCNTYYGVVEDGQICIDSSGGKGTCNGDSGGPINKDGKVHGITSYGSAKGCEAGHPDVFTRVHRYLKWIEHYTGIKP